MSGEDKIGVFYGSSTGNVETIANLIKKNLNGIPVDIFDVSKITVEEVYKYPIIIFGVSTWGVGDIQEDFEEFFQEINLQKLNNKTIALYGLGDQVTYTDCFVEGMGKLYEKIKSLNIRLIGNWKKNGYTFNKSSAFINGRFIGLVIDEDNQEELTIERVKAWALQLQNELGVT